MHSFLQQLFGTVSNRHPHFGCPNPPFLDLEPDEFTRPARIPGKVHLDHDRRMVKVADRDILRRSAAAALDSAGGGAWLEWVALYCRFSGCSLSLC